MVQAIVCGERAKYYASQLLEMRTSVLNKTFFILSQARTSTHTHRLRKQAPITERTKPIPSSTRTVLMNDIFGNLLDSSDSVRIYTVQLCPQESNRQAFNMFLQGCVLCNQRLPPVYCATKFFMTRHTRDARGACCAAPLIKEYDTRHLSRRKFNYKFASFKNV